MFNCYYFKEEESLSLYKKLLRNSDKKLPYFVIEYLSSFCMNINLGCFFVFENEKCDSYVVMPGYLRNIIIGEEFTGYKDFISPYGYYGPFGSKNIAENDLRQFWIELDKWYREQNVISEFIRFGLDENFFKAYSGQLIPTLRNIKGKIINKEDQWSNFEHKVRKNVKKAQREGLVCDLYFKNISSEIIDIFYSIYIHTMERTNATNRFFYSEEKFKDFVFNNPELSAVAIIRYKDIPVAAELLLVGNESIYSFLGGTLSDYFDKRPNDLLKFEVINWARENNIKYYVLGGGYGADDGIYRYKKSFFPDNSVTFYTGRKILNEQAYYDLIRRSNVERKKSGLIEILQDDKSFFPLYRK